MDVPKNAPCKTFTWLLFSVILFLLFYHLGTSCFMFWLLLKPLYNRIPRWFSTFLLDYVQNLNYITQVSHPFYLSKALNSKGRNKFLKRNTMPITSKTAPIYKLRIVLESKYKFNTLYFLCACQWHISWGCWLKMTIILFHFKNWIRPFTALILIEMKSTKFKLYNITAKKAS